MYNKQLSGGSSVCTGDNHSLKLVAFRPVHTDEQYTRLHIYRINLFSFVKTGTFIPMELEILFMPNLNNSDLHL